MATHPPELYGLSIQYIARLCQVDLSTARRWKRGATCPPVTALKLLSGDLGMFSPAWQGWTVQHDLLISPEGWQLTPAETLAVPLMRAQIAEYQRLQRAQRALEDALDDQPTPAQWVIEASG